MERANDKAYQGAKRYICVTVPLRKRRGENGDL